MVVIERRLFSYFWRPLTLRSGCVLLCIILLTQQTCSKPLKVFSEKDQQLTIDKLKPQDHLDALKLEQDGHINKEYHKELFLGNHEEIEKDEKTADEKLKDIFYRVDENKDKLLSQLELENWIKEKMTEHFDEAVQENNEIFSHLDPDNNGKVHWKEYYVHFLLAMNIPEEKAKKHVMDYDVVEMNEEAKENIIRYKFRWTDADEDPADNELTKTEFLAFRHPEHAPKTLNNMVNSIIDTLDTDKDDELTEKEFIALPPGEVEDDEQRDLDVQWQEERRKEFRESVDTNRDGKATAEELRTYLDPKNPLQAVLEGKNLISLIDANRDRKLSLSEIMARKDIFLSSKMCDFARNLHDEF